MQNLKKFLVISVWLNAILTNDDVNWLFYRQNLMSVKHFLMDRYPKEMRYNSIEKENSKKHMFVISAQVRVENWEELSIHL